MEWANLPSVKGASLTTQYVLVTVAVAGLQFVWSIEQAYVNVYLLDLGMTKSALSLMWLAGPSCGLVVQPVVGVASDFCTSRHGRRRPFMVWGAIVVALGLLAFGWAREIGGFVGVSPIAAAVVAVLVVDVAVNTCQACCRALIVDMFSAEHQTAANGWASRMGAVGHLASYYLGSVDLTRLGFASQMKAASVLYSAVLLACVATSSAAVTERVLITEIAARRSFITELALIVKRLFQTTLTLDRRLQEIFKVQLLAWYAWFTFLFYGSTYASEVWRHTLAEPPSTGEMARAGSLALAVFSLSSTLFTVVLPKLRTDILNIWSASFVVYAVAIMLTYFATTFHAVLAIFSVVGFSWAASLWIPFALTSKRIHELPSPPLPEGLDLEQQQAQHPSHPQHQRHDPYQRDPQYSPTRRGEYAGPYEHEALHGLSHLSPEISPTTLRVLNDVNVPDSCDEQSGIILGIHNSALTLPQFMSAFGSHVIFKLMDVDPSNPHSDGGRVIALTLQVGAFTALLAAFYSYRLKFRH